MLFESLFNGEKGITVGKRRKRKLTVRDVIDRLNKFDLTTANCTLIRDHLGNEKIENYGQVDIFRVRDEEIFSIDNTFCITTPTGMKLKGDVGETQIGHMVSMVSSGSIDSGENLEREETEHDETDNDIEGDEVLVPIQAESSEKKEKNKPPMRHQMYFPQVGRIKERNPLKK